VSIALWRSVGRRPDSVHPGGKRAPAVARAL